MPDTASITTVKAFTYRGKREEFSNKYHFTGTTPTSDAGWKALADAIIAGEKRMLHTGVKFVRAYGYAAGNELSVAQIDYEAAPLTPAVGLQVSGSANALMQPESTLMLRWRTNERNSRKKWIYLRKYFHGSISTQAGDAVAGIALEEAAAFNTLMTGGSLPGGAKYCGPQGAPAGAFQADPYCVSRELKRRGKRPSS